MRSVQIVSHLRQWLWGSVLSLAVILIGTPSSSTVTQASVAAQAKYTKFDDVSWAITNPRKLASPYHQELYDNFMKGCNEETGGACQSGEEFRLNMNRLQPSGVYNYTQVCVFVCATIFFIFFDWISNTLLRSKYFKKLLKDWI